MASVFEFELDHDGMRVRKWRQQQLEQAGYSEFSAFRVAMRFDIDLHMAVDLIAKAIPRLGADQADRWAVDQLLD